MQCIFLLFILKLLYKQTIKYTMPTLWRVCESERERSESE